ncbi:MAG: polysaccharide export protein EpsE [Hydrogenophaga sp.]|uniref:polysaccharide export protein EpsE n=1 Tax=Hydrogenophaga sp. TaxID=1904254 RepID=UPI00257C5C42|nr:polysaccharide export protein EpsE [Hydrogenophaga sp.]MBL0943586.1 polysaccharide export protein EpsE [Hydrogenophaga sp.]
MRRLVGLTWLVRAWAVLVLCVPAWAQSPSSGDYPLAAGDVIRVQVFQNQDLTLETRISESGTISYPLIGTVRLGGLTVAAAERRIAEALRTGGFLQNPQVTLLLTQVRGSQVSVLGQVSRPGRFPLESTNTRLTDMLANAGGATPSGDDVVIVSGEREGKPFRRTVDLPALFLQPGSAEDLLLQAGDVVYVHRAPMFYVFGEAQRPGAFRVDRDLTVMQAIAQAGGPTPRGTLRRLQLHRTQADGTVQTFEPSMTERIQPNDVLQLRESLF